MILVTGGCRSGSSLVMQTLQLLGVPIAGEAHHDDFPIKEGNPKGYYDMPFIHLLHGIGSEFSDKAIKLFGTALPKILYPNTVSHAIVCMRKDLNAQDASAKKLIDMELKTETDSPLRQMVIGKMADLTLDDISSQRRKTYIATFEFLKNYHINYMKVYYETVLLQPEVEINKMVDFLGIKVSEKQIKEAKGNVDV